MAKAQITIYIVIGAVMILIAILGFVLFNNPNDTPVSSDSIPDDQIEQFVLQCVKDSAVPLLYEMASNSGYLYVPPGSIDTGYSEVAYYFDKGDVDVITEEEMKVEIQDYMNRQLPKCIDGFKSFGQLNITIGTLETNVVLAEQETVFEVYLPLSIEGDSMKRYSFKSKVPIRINHLRKIAEDIANNIAKDPSWLDLSYLSSYDVDVNMLPYNRTVIVFSLTDEMSSMNDDPFIYLFAAGFERHDEPYFEIPSELNALDDERFSYKIAGDSGLAFEDDTPLFNIIGYWINFTPQVTGTFDVRVTAFNQYGLSEEKNVRVIIHEK